ncbi:MAG: thermonuclease family protein [Azospirillum sp.]|nr:thermonuclease family protein [Azospirillum sp.]
MRSGAALFLGTALALATPASAEDLAGPVDKVHDGDTLTLNGTHIRLWGIDAPELAQQCLDAAGSLYACGIKSKMALEALTAGQPVACTDRGHDRYRRTVASCTVHGIDLGSMLVQAGQAVDYPKYSEGHYRPEQQHAAAAHLGVWAGWFDLPWEWRHKHPAP